MCVSVHVCVFVCLCVSGGVNLFVFLCGCMYMCLGVCVCMHLCLSVCVSVHVYLSMYVCVFMWCWGEDLVLFTSEVSKLHQGATPFSLPKSEDAGLRAKRKYRSG